MYTTQEMVRISKMYYELKMTQQEIAEKENISRPTVSRILDTAVKEGIVSFMINYPSDSISDLAEELKAAFGLHHVFVAPVYVKDMDMILRDVGKGLSDYLSRILKDGDSIGITWGNTLSYVSANLQPMNKKDIKVIQLNGSVSTKAGSTGSMSILDEFSKAVPAVPYMLPVPAIVDSVSISNAIMGDSSVKEILSMGKRANIAVFAIGRASYESILFKAGYFSETYYGELLDKGAVGDILSRFYNLEGNLVDYELNNRTIGLNLEDMKEKEYSIAISCGEEKAQAVLGALNGKYMNILFTDENTAREVLKLNKQRKKKEEIRL